VVFAATVAATVAADVFVDDHIVYTRTFDTDTATEKRLTTYCWFPFSADCVTMWLELRTIEEEQQERSRVFIHRASKTSPPPS